MSYIAVSGTGKLMHEQEGREDKFYLSVELNARLYNERMDPPTETVNMKIPISKEEYNSLQENTLKSRSEAPRIEIEGNLEVSVGSASIN